MPIISQKDFEFVNKFESMIETLNVLNIIGNALTEKGRTERKNLEKWIEENAGRYLELTGR